jgi:hypothetical protein
MRKGFGYDYEFTTKVAPAYGVYTQYLYSYDISELVISLIECC